MYLRACPRVGNHGRWPLFRYSCVVRCRKQMPAICQPILVPRRVGVLCPATGSHCQPNWPIRGMVNRWWGLLVGNVCLWLLPRFGLNAGLFWTLMATRLQRFYLAHVHRKSHRKLQMYKSPTDSYTSMIFVASATKCWIFSQWPFVA